MSEAIAHIENQSLPAEPPALCFDAITKTFGPVTALQDVCLAVEAGSVPAVIGQNAARAVPSTATFGFRLQIFKGMRPGWNVTGHYERRYAQLPKACLASLGCCSCRVPLFGSHPVFCALTAGQKTGRGEMDAWLGKFANNEYRSSR